MKRLFVILAVLTAFVNAFAQKSTTPADKVYKVGDYYNDGVDEGVVFEVFEGGKSGKIVSMTQSKLMHWVEFEQDCNMTVGLTSATDGAVNFAKIKKLDGWQGRFPAFQWCAALGPGWYLPSERELYTIMDKINVLNKKLKDPIGVSWSSTEPTDSRSVGKNYATSVHPGSQTGTFTVKSTKWAKHRARAVKVFGAPSKRPTGVKTYNIGDYYSDGVKEGIVFEVTDDGLHGKIVHLEHSLKRFVWATDEQDQTAEVGTNCYYDGQKNLEVIKKIEGWEQKYPAFKWCVDQGEGWYMPSRVEMEAIGQNRAKIEPQLIDQLSNYWCSTEAGLLEQSNVYQVFRMAISDRYTGSNWCPKSSTSHVRAVACF